MRPAIVFVLALGCATASDGPHAAVTFRDYTTNALQVCGLSEVDDYAVARSVCYPQPVKCQQSEGDKEWSFNRFGGGPAQDP